MDTDPADPGRTDWLAVLAVVAVTFAVQWPFRLLTLSLIDEGALFQTGNDLLAGSHLYTDIVHPSFPGIHWAMALTFWLLGNTMESARVFGAALFAITVGAMVTIGRWWLSRRATAGLLLLALSYRVWAYPHWHMVSYSSLGVGLVLVAVAVLGHALARPGVWRFVVVGLLVGLAVLAKQDIGPLGGVLVALATILSRPHAAGPVRPALTAIAAGIALVGVPSLAYVVWTGTFLALVEHTLLAPLYGLQNFPYQSRPPLLPLFAQDAGIREQLFSYAPTILLDLWLEPIIRSPFFQRSWLPDLALKVIYYLPIPVALVGVAVVAARRLRWGRPTTATGSRWELLVLTALVFLAAFNRPHDWIHLLILYPPTLLLSAALLAALVGALPQVRRVVTTGAAMVLCATFAISAAVAGQFLRAYDTPLVTTHGVEYGPAPQASAVQSLLDDLRTVAPVDAPLIALPYAPLLHYLADRPRVPPYLHVWPFDTNPHRETDIIAAIERNPRTLVVYSPTQIPHFPRFAESAPVLFEHLVRSYRITRSYGGAPNGYTFLLLERRLPEQSRSLLDVLPSAKSTIAFEPSALWPTPLGDTPLAAEVHWPFARVLRVVLVSNATVTTTFPVRVTAGTRLALGFGMNPDHWLHFPNPRGRFVVALRVEAREVILADEDVSPSDDPRDRQWRPIDVDLTPYAGQTVSLELRVTGIASGAPRFDAAGFSEPRLIDPAP